MSGYGWGIGADPAGGTAPGASPATGEPSPVRGPGQPFGDIAGPGASRLDHMASTGTAYGPGDAGGHQTVPPVPDHLRRRPPGVARALAVSALIGAVVGGSVGAAVVALAGSNSQTQTIVKEIAPGPAFTSSGQATVRSVLTKVQPAVVSIEASTTPSPPVVGGYGFTSPAQTVQNEGTGMIISANGFVLTNNHVISGSTSVSVTLFGRSTASPATVVGTDPTDDIALLKISGASGLPTVSFGDSSLVQVGDEVVAIGNALGLGGAPTVTQGIISAEGRSIQAGDTSSGTVETLTNMLQTDAAINPGSSGGPLVDTAGQVIGMTTAVASSSSGNAAAQNIGFAIPINKVKQLLPLVERGGAQSTGGYLGADVVSVTPSVQSSLGLAVSAGALVTQIVTGSPAEAAGLQLYDVIVAVDSTQIVSADALSSALGLAKPGETVTLTVSRSLLRLSMQVTLSRAPAA